MKKLIYLASPYSHPNKYVRLRRFHEVTYAGVRLIQQGHHIFGPITESHSYSETDENIGKGWEFWKEHDELMLSKCDEVWILTLPGWKESVGVTAEIEYARQHKMPVKYLDPNTLNFIQDRFINTKEGK